MPVFPLVGSTIVSPGLRWPSRSAVSIMFSAIRSFTLPAGFIDSTLPRTSAEPAGTTRFSRTIGVPPTRSSTVSAIFLSLLINPLYHVPGSRWLQRAVTPRQVSEGDVVEHPYDGVTDFSPHLALSAASVASTRTTFIEAVRRHDRPFQRLNHLGHPNS